MTASKGYKVLAAKASRENNNRKSKMYDKKSNELLKEYEKLNEKSENTMSNFLKTKWTTIADSSESDRGRKYIESLSGLTIDANKVDAYETKYSKNPRYSKGYSAERDHVRSLIDKHKD